MRGMTMWAVTFDGDVYATFETRAEALSYFYKFANRAVGKWDVVAWEPQ